VLGANSQHGLVVMHRSTHNSGGTDLESSGTIKAIVGRRHVRMCSVLVATAAEGGKLGITGRAAAKRTAGQPCGEVR
jgi:hypothetical protein